MLALSTVCGILQIHDVKGVGFTPILRHLTANIFYR